MVVVERGQGFANGRGLEHEQIFTPIWFACSYKSITGSTSKVDLGRSCWPVPASHPSFVAHLSMRDAPLFPVSKSGIRSTMDRFLRAVVKGAHFVNILEIFKFETFIGHRFKDLVDSVVFCKMFFQVLEKIQGN